MALIKLSQINNGVKLSNALNSILLKKYDDVNATANYDGAELVGFTLHNWSALTPMPEEGNLSEQEGKVYKYFDADGNVKETAEGATQYKFYTISENEKVTVAEMLQKLSDDVKSIMGEGDGLSLSSLDERLQTVEDTQIVDYIKITDVDDVANYDCLTGDEKYNLYATADGDNNKTIYIKTTTPAVVEGEDPVVTYAPATVTIGEDEPSFPELQANQKFCVIDGSSKTGYKEYSLDTGYKFFVKANIDLFGEDANSSFLIDNEELKIIAQENAIVALAQRLSTEETLMEEVRTAIGETAIQAALAETTATLDARITANKTHATDNSIDIATLTDRLQTVEGKNLETHKLEKVTIGENGAYNNDTKILTITFGTNVVAVAGSVKVLINGIAYPHYEDGIDVGSDNKTVTVQGKVSDENLGIGFDLDTTNDTFGVEYDVVTKVNSTDFPELVSTKYVPAEEENPSA